MNTIKIKFLSKSEGILPYKGSEFSAGWDLRVTKRKILYPRHVHKIPLGFATEMPHNIYGSISIRSSLAAKGLILLNAPGIIDADFVGEWKLLVRHTGATSLVLLEGDRVAQVIFHRVLPIEWKTVKKLSDTKRGDGGFGSSGR